MNGTIAALPLVIAGLLGCLLGWQIVQPLVVIAGVIAVIAGIERGWKDGRPTQAPVSHGPEQ